MPCPTTFESTFLSFKALITGANGQLGRELQRTATDDAESIAFTREQLDIADAASVRQQLQLLRPEVLINAAAYTAVDKAESEPEVAWQINAEGPGVLAQVCADEGVRLIHISTDFVFDGSAATPYQPGAAPAPMGEYGRSKLGGEAAVTDALPEAVIIRTGWVYSAFGNNFVKTMLRLMQERDELSVVADQVGTPTWAFGLAHACWAVARHPSLQGIYHWSDAGECSWYEFALAIAEDATALHMLDKPVQVQPIPGSQYPTPARRPAYSVLDKTTAWRDFEMQGVHWRQQLVCMLEELKEMTDA